MALLDDLTNETNGIISQAWSIRDGVVVPTSDSVMLSGGGVKLEAVMLYADLAESTKLAMDFDSRVAAKVVKAFLSGCCRIIRAHNGHIRSFDGDRVMGVFVEKAKNTNAATCGLKINWLVKELLRPRFHSKYPTLVDRGFEINHGVGIDRSDVLVVRSGIRAHNDLVWIGRAPNIAAKLANVRDRHQTIITKDVFDIMLDGAKFGGALRQPMWEARTWTEAPVADLRNVYSSDWWWRP
ncbi:hypothetical protein FKV24_003775 [Lysobacter maris]|uniref:Uncharacterized protein n=1 Tax=Marilutibacter maris TaxID=1605891 RepID=A0A508B0T7_9GAMM|nr:hypothetical protein FKV24_003775 [Lysobacter maris]